MRRDKIFAEQNWLVCAVGIIRVRLGKEEHRIATVGEAAKAIGTVRANVYKWMKAGTMRQAGYVHIRRVAELSGLPEAWLVQERRDAET